MTGLVMLTLVLAAAPKPVEATPALAISAGYLGELATHPGAFVGLERPLFTRGPHAFFLNGRLGGYHHAGHHNGLLLRADLGYRVTAGSGLFGEVLAGVGLHHRLLAGPVYVESGEAGVTRQADAGQLTFMPGLALGAGWETERRGPWPNRWFLRADGWARAPVNGGWLPAVALSLGVSWTVGGAT